MNKTEGTHRKSQDRAARRLPAERVAPAGDQDRPLFHFTPPQGWLNDPNGLIYWRGQYHLFYQHNPYDVRWAWMHWGHAVSRDLLHWRHLPLALTPSEAYDNAPMGGCFSGSAVDDQGVLALVYTGVGQAGRQLHQTQCLATSTDGIVFHKFPENPVVLPPEGCAPEDFRDPKVWRYEGAWYMVCGASLGGRGSIVLYTSSDLRRWRYVGIVLQDSTGRQAMWECPDLFDLDGKQVLLVSEMHSRPRRNVYYVGRLNYQTGQFVPEHSGLLDEGSDFYAAQTLLSAKGKRVLLAWQSAWDALPGRPGAPYCGSMTLPRELSLVQGQLCVQPLAALRRLRLLPPLWWGRRDLPAGGTMPVLVADGVHYELTLTFCLNQSTAKSVGLRLGRGPTDAVALDIEIDIQARQIQVQRYGGPAVTKRQFAFTPERGQLTLKLFSDSTAVEFFVNRGQSAFSALVDGPADTGSLVLRASGGRARLSRLVGYGLSMAPRQG